MEDKFYLGPLKRLKRGNMDLYYQALKEVCGKELEWSEVKELDDRVIAEISHKLKDLINLSRSPVDPKKIAYWLQNSLSGVGGCAMTEFECELCGREETWGNTNTPGICSVCASKMANKIAQRDIYKDELDFDPDFERI